MTGVSILTSKEIYNTILPEWCIGIGVMLTFVFVMMTIYFTGEKKLFQDLICIVLTLCSVGMVIMGNTDNKNSIDYIEYKVTIDDSVSMTEFMDKYEILDQEGKIYTVKEREN